MIPLLLGTDKETGDKFHIDPDILRTHLHLVGATGAGKTTAIHTILRPLMMQPRDKCCLFVIDPMGNLSMDLLRFIAHERYCPQHVRDRLVYIEAANEDIVLPFNPLTHSSEGQRYYNTMRAVDIVLRAWAAQDVSQQPRLLQWMYKSFCAAASMGLPISMCRYLVHPGTDEHRALLRHLPEDIASHWLDILNASGSESTRILESTRNRLDPFFESVCLRRMFGTARSHFDCERFIRERRIVILNLAKYGKLPGFIADTIGALALNEIVETASRMSTNEGKAAVEPTYVLMDEFQKFVGVDIEDALPTVRQMGLRLMLAHQSFSQLEREDVDLTQMIWQARSRLIFANSARDADIVADELGKLTFNPKEIKDIRYSKKQLIVGYRKEWLESVSDTATQSSAEMDQETIGYNQNRGESRRLGPSSPTRMSGAGHQNAQAKGRTAANSAAHTAGRSQANVPIHEIFDEISNITFQSFEEFSIKWGQAIRRLGIGQAFGWFADDDRVRAINIDHFPIPDSAELREAVERLKETNYASDLFISGAEADRECLQYRQNLLAGQIPGVVLPGQREVIVDTEGVTESPPSENDLPYR